MRHLISSEALVADPSYLVFDCRFSLTDPDAGRRQYEAGHIPGARFVDLERDLSGPRRADGAGGRHPLPERGALARRLRDLGVDRDSRLVGYDQNSGALAARFWWLARWLGHDRVAVLDGGLDAWVASGLPLDVDGVPLPLAPGNFEAGEPLTRACTAEAVQPGETLLLDARDAERFSGKTEPLDRIAGHIPGAISAPFSGNLMDGRLRSPAALRQRFEALGLGNEHDIVCYCGSGVTAAHNVLALLVAGFPEPVLYTGSWSDWISHPDRPVATG